tara:strand:+ start:2803 stop:3126 length:324 start_codon:yes stop_codon:yes gene_type:complete
MKQKVSNNEVLNSMNNFYKDINNNTEYIRNYKESLNHKKKIVYSEYFNIDEKDYIPVEDFFLMLDNPSMNLTPSKYIESVKESPEEFEEYLNDPRPICPWLDYFNEI